MIDLHTHSTASDGADHPRDLINLAHKSGLRAIALTDHDTLTGLSEAALEAEALKMLFLPSVEIEISSEKGVFHLLGLNLDMQKTQAINQLNAALLEEQDKRNQRNVAILAKLTELGMPCFYAEVQALAKDVVGRVHIAQYLVHKGYVKHQQMAFDKYLGDGRPAFIRKEAFSLEAAITLIHAAGGKAIVAHPLSLYQSWRVLEESFKQFKALGVDGLEAYHSNNKLSESHRLAQMATKLDWLITAGSDYHGAKYRSRRLGYATAGQKIDSQLLIPLLRADQLEYWQQISIKE